MQVFDKAQINEPLLEGGDGDDPAEALKGELARRFQPGIAWKVPTPDEVETAEMRKRAASLKANADWLNELDLEDFLKEHGQDKLRTPQDPTRGFIYSQGTLL